MKVAIVYDSRTGTTKAAAEEMAQMAVSIGHEATAVAVQAASHADVSAADAVCVGSWTEGLFFILQHATKATMEFIDSLSLDGTPGCRLLHLQDLSWQDARQNGQCPRNPGWSRDRQLPLPGATGSGWIRGMAQLAGAGLRTDWLQ